MSRRSIRGDPGRCAAAVVGCSITSCKGKVALTTWLVVVVCVVCGVVGESTRQESVCLSVNQVKKKKSKVRIKVSPCRSEIVHSFVGRVGVVVVVVQKYLLRRSSCRRILGPHLRFFKP